MPRKSHFFYIGFFILLTALILSASVFNSNFFICLSLGIIGTLIMFFTVFEKSHVSTEKIVLIALLSSLAAAGRVLFTAIPNVQPVSFLVIITGIVFGGEIGFITGAVSALTSNLIMGQGPWTLWQMFAWGLMGLVSALLSNRLNKNKWLLAGYSFVWGFLFDYIMNIWVLITNNFSQVNWSALIVALSSSFYFDLLHAVGNAVLALLLGSRFIKILGRIAVKYGLLPLRKA